MSTTPDERPGRSLEGSAILLAVATGVFLLRRAFARAELLPEEVALASAWVFVVGSLVWLDAFLSGKTLLGFGAPWTWITASHFVTAGFGAVTITALTCRAVSDTQALRTLRFLLVAHPVAYLVTAAGISGWPYGDKLGTTGCRWSRRRRPGCLCVGASRRSLGASDSRHETC